MIFRNLYRLVPKSLGFISIGLFMLTFITHCAERNEEQRLKNANEINMKGLKLECISNFSETLDRYLNHRISEEELKEFWSCMDSALTLFEKYVDGKVEEKYRDEEVRGFLAEYFNFHMSDDLFQSLMSLKSALLSKNNPASVQFVTSQDLMKARELFQELDILTHRLYAHWPTLFGKKGGASKSPAVFQVDQAFQDLEMTLSRFGLWMEVNKAQLNTEVLTRFVESLDLQISFFNLDLRQWLDVFLASKELLIGSSLTVQPGEWDLFFKVGIRVFETYTRYRYFLHGQPLTHGQGFHQVYSMVNKVERLLVEILSNQRIYGAKVEKFLKKEPGKGPEKGYSLTSRDFYYLIDTLESVELLPQGRWSGSLIKSGWNLLVHRFLMEPLGSTRSIETAVSQPLQSFGFSHLEILRAEFQDWAVTQTFINEGRLIHGESGEKSEKLQCGQIEGAGGVNEMRRLVLCAPWPLHKDREGHLNLSRRLLNLSWTTEDLSSLNWKRALIRQLVRSYSDKPEGEGAGLTEKQLGVAYVELKPFLVAFGLMSKENDSFYRSLFVEASLFTPWSDGDQKLSLGEGVAYLDYVLTSFRRANFLVSNMSHCLVAPHTSEELKASCYWEALRFQIIHHFGAMSDLSDYVRALSDSSWAEMSIALDAALGGGSQKSGLITKSYIVRMLSLISYVETLVLRYDTNLNQLLSLGEAERSVPLFFPIFSSRWTGFSQLEEAEFSTLLSFLLKYGTVPGGGRDDKLLGFRFYHWKRLPEKRVLSAERLHIIKVLTFLKSNI